MVGGDDVTVVKKEEDEIQQEVDKDEGDGNSQISSVEELNKLYEFTRIHMKKLPGVNDSFNTNKAFLLENKSLQDLIFAIRALADAYFKEIPGSTRLSNGGSLLVVDSEWTNLYACLCYVKRQLYPLVLLNNNFDDSLMCHFECVLDLYDGNQ